MDRAQPQCPDDDRGSTQPAGPIRTPPSAGSATNLSDRERLYQANTLARTSGSRLAGDDDLHDCPVSALGLERNTISRLYHLGLLSIGELYATSVDELWRRLGRQGMTDIVNRLEFHGLRPPRLKNYQLWRLGLIAKNSVSVDVRPTTPVHELWPRVGAALAESLHRRELHTVLDLAPRSMDDVRQLYRLGKTNLRVLRGILADAGKRGNAGQRDVLRTGTELIDRLLGDRASAAPRGAARSRMRTSGAGGAVAAPASRMSD
ncbi:MAG: hypothetical protein GC151_14200 [Betaproteobacteria bacterium]|nr:hypothetical protein [Betaproteobacteria bacterium]